MDHRSDVLTRVGTEGEAAVYAAAFYLSLLRNTTLSVEIRRLLLTIPERTP